MLNTYGLGIRVCLTVIFTLVRSHFCAAQLELAADLAQEADWEGCLRECRRVLLVSPANHTTLVLKCAANLCLDRDVDASFSCLERLFRSAISPEILTSAAYERGRAQWKMGRHNAAFESFQFAFYNASQTDIFLKSACSLFQLAREKPALAKRSSDLHMQINSTRELWCGKLFRECRIRPVGSGIRLLGRPGAWIAAFYRAHIRPAIGPRCSLKPSCSEYFRQACLKHGLLGFPIQADRFFREPRVAAEKTTPVAVGEVIKYADPLSDHDFWMKRNDDTTGPSTH